MKKSNQTTKTKKAMKKTIIYLSMAALAMVGVVFTGCTNDDEIENPQQPENKVETLTATVSIDGEGDTRALDIDALNKKVVKTFAEGDKIAVVYKNTSGTTVKAESVELAAGDITNEGKSANFTVTLEDADKTKNVTYIYPAAMAKDDGSANYDALATQNGTLASLASNFDYCEFSGAWSAGQLPTGTMSNKLAICAFTLKDDATPTANEITSTVTKLTVSDGTNIYTVTRSAVAGPIYVAMRPTDNKTISFQATAGTKIFAKYVKGKTYAAGNMYQLGLKMAEVPVNGISGIFSVSSTKKVFFSKGNLQATGTTSSTSSSGWTWSFATNQWDKIGNATANTSISGNGKISANGTVDLFGWSTSTTYLGINNSTANNDYRGDFVEWGSHSDVTKGIGTGWRTLTSDEWRYVLVTRTTTSGKHYCKAKVNDVFGVILLPDDWSTSYYNLQKCDVVDLSFSDGAITDQISLSDWNASFVPHGAVFLPTTGHRYASDNTSVEAPDGRLYYWSSTSGANTSGTSANANQMYIAGNSVAPDTGAGRHFGNAVRLVYDIK